MTAAGYAGERVAVKPWTANAPPEAACTRFPLVPVTDTPMLPEPPAGALTVIVAVPAPVIVAGENAAVKPVGKEGAVRVTAPLNPLSAPTVTVYAAPFPPAVAIGLGDCG